MRAIITFEPSCNVTSIEMLVSETVFHLETGLSLRVGVPPNRLAALLKLDLSRPSSDLPTDIFCHPFMSRSTWDTIAPIVRTHRDIRRAFKGHQNLETQLQLDYDQLRLLPLRAYGNGPRGLYLSYPVNFFCTCTDSAKADSSTEFHCDFTDGNYLVKVLVDTESQTVVVTT